MRNHDNNACREFTMIVISCVDYSTACTAGLWPRDWFSVPQEHLLLRLRQLPPSAHEEHSGPKSHRFWHGRRLREVPPGSQAADRRGLQRPALHPALHPRPKPVRSAVARWRRRLLDGPSWPLRSALLCLLPERGPALAARVVYGQRWGALRDVLHQHRGAEEEAPEEAAGGADWALEALGLPARSHVKY